MAGAAVDFFLSGFGNSAVNLLVKNIVRLNFWFVEKTPNFVDIFVDKPVTYPQDL